MTGNSLRIQRFLRGPVGFLEKAEQGLLQMPLLISSVALISGSFYQPKSEYSGYRYQCQRFEMDWQ